MPTNEYIKRIDALNTIHSVPPGNWSRARYMDAVERVPAADVEPVRHGWWIPGDHFEYDGHGETVRHPGGITCSQCRYNFAEKYLWSRSYCPHCGAKMDKEEDDGTL